MPILSAQFGGSNTNNSIFGGATSDVVDSGTFYGYVSESATPPSAADLIAGTGAVAAENAPRGASASQTLNIGGLQANTAYYMHLLHEDPVANYSNIVTTGPHTTEPASPVISLPVASSIDATDVTLGCTSDVDVQAGGELRAVIDLPANIDGILEFQINNGHNETNSAALSAGTAAATGLNPSINMPASALTDGVTYAYAMVYVDHNGNSSNVLNTGTFVHSTAGGPVVNPGIREICTNGGVPLADGVQMNWVVYDTFGGVELAEGITAITGGNGTLEIDSDLLGAVGATPVIAAHYTGGSALKTTVTVIDLNA